MGEGLDLILSSAARRGGTLSELRKKIGMGRYGAVSKAIFRFQERVQHDAKLQALLHKASSALSYVQV